MNDPQLESLLRGADRSADLPRAMPADLADRVRQSWMQRQQRLRRWRQAGVMTTCYVAGLLSMWFIMAASSRPAAAPSGHAAAPNPAERRAAEDVKTSGSRSLPRVATPSATAPSRYQVLRQLGLESRQRHDFFGAVEYYRQALQSASVDERRISDADDWLLIRLKTELASSTSGPESGDSI